MVDSLVESLCDDIFKKTLAPLDQVLKDAEMSKNDINDIVLVGGSTRIPRVQELLSNYFNGKELNKSINPDEAVAYGAAIQANILSVESDKKTENILLIDITSMSVGIEIAGGVYKIMIPKNTALPCSKEEIFTTSTDMQPSVTIKVFDPLVSHLRVC